MKHTRPFVGKGSPVAIIIDGADDRSLHHRMPQSVTTNSQRGSDMEALWSTVYGLKASVTGLEHHFSNVTGAVAAVRGEFSVLNHKITELPKDMGEQINNVVESLSEILASLKCNSSGDASSENLKKMVPVLTQDAPMPTASTPHTVKKVSLYPTPQKFDGPSWCSVTSRKTGTGVDFSVLGDENTPLVSGGGVYKPDYFTGSAEMPLERYEAHFFFCCKANGWSKRTAASQLLTSLRGPPVDAVNGLPEEAWEGPYQIFYHLRNHFGHSQSWESWMSQLFARARRSGENSASFGADLRKLGHLAFPDLLPVAAMNDILRSRLLSGLWPETRRAIDYPSKTSFDDVLGAAIEFESFESSKTFG